MIESLTLQQLLLQHFAEYLGSHKLDRHRLKVCRHLLSCHTPALGGIAYQCDHCHDQFPLYHGCRDRHCPQGTRLPACPWSIAAKTRPVLTSITDLIAPLFLGNELPAGKIA